jgi:nitrite reductase (NADH) small subunit
VKASHLRITLADAPAEGEVRLVELDGHTIGLYRIGDRYHALADRCPHRAAPLASAGRVVRGIALEHGTPTRGAAPGLLRCPWHKWDFDIATGRCLVHPRLRVRRYQIEPDGDDLIITLRHPTAPDDAPEPQSERPALAELGTAAGER